MNRGPAAGVPFRPDGTIGAEGVTRTGGRAYLLQLIHQRPAWHADAACKEHPEITWFPARGKRSERAKAICAGCLVRNECLDYAVDHELTDGDRHGIWGGLPPHERALLARRPA